MHVYPQCRADDNSYVKHRSISRISYENGISPLYIIVEIYHSGRKPLMLLIIMDNQKKKKKKQIGAQWVHVTPKCTLHDLFTLAADRVKA